MQIYSTYKVKIKHYNHIFKETVAVYRNAVDYLLEVCNENWEEVSQLNGNMDRLNFMERLTHATKNHSDPKYDFDRRFYKMPAYLRRSAITEALGKIASYKSNLSN